jgi:hypothetical protein
MLRAPMKSRLARVATSFPFRLAFALAIVAFHLAAMTRLAHDRLNLKFNASPDAAPAFHNPDGSGNLDRWDRLIVSRWDAQHYLGLGARGYRFCKDPSQLKPGQFPDDDKSCQLHFYPGYALLGAGVSRVTGLPIDYALFGVSLVACIALSLLWTSRTMTRTLGVGAAYLSLILLNTFTSGFILVTIETEPVLMALSLAAFICVARRWWLAGALLAGLSSGIRITGVATGFAFCVAILIATLRDRPRPGLAWVKSGALMALSGWGVMVMMGYFWVRFGDPMTYSHSHWREYHMDFAPLRALFPDGRVLMQSLWAEPNDGVFFGAALLWFALGHREGLRRFDLEGQAFWYTLFFFVVGMSAAGSVDNGFGGAARYVLVALPLFFAMAGAMRGKVAVLAIWLILSVAHYYNGGICFYESQYLGDRAQRCGFARYFRSDELREARHPR